MTKRETLNYLIENYGKDNVVVDFANHELELLNKKNSNRSNKNSEEDTKITDMIIEAISNLTTNEKSMFTITEILSYETLRDYICDNGKALSNSKITALVRKEIENANPRIVNVKTGKTSLYGLV